MRPADKMFDAEVRIHDLIWIPGLIAAGEDDMPDYFQEEFLEYLPDAPDARLYKQLPPLAKFAGDEGVPWEPEYIFSALAPFNGFLVRPQTPVRRYSGKVIYSSWGVTHWEWLYAATEGDLAGVAIEWAEARHEADRRKSEAA